ncbi:hypothetical protein LCGC14_1269970 [marine sediment metagenome]|uniref:Uncharacterized protein n=1 Tax=marine sediment metagenome TaxID=412755 RepID=A0A0F9P1H3_9ZZZZ
MSKTCGDFGGHKRQDDKGPCGLDAGWKTDHPGEGKCTLHGGSVTGRPVIHGRYSVKHKQELQDKMQEFLEDPQPGNLMSELALQRAMLQDFVERLGDTVLIDVIMRKHVFDMIESISKVVERISRILNSTAITAAELQLLQMALPDLLLRYIDEPEKRLAFMGELRQLIGTPSQAHRSQITSSVSDQD